MSSRIPAPVVQSVLDRCAGVCEALIPGVCIGQAQQLHHRKLRSQGGGHTVENLVYICHMCHSYIHGHTGWAYENELLVRGWDEPRFPPALYMGVKEGKRIGTDTDD